MKKTLLKYLQDNECNSKSTIALSECSSYLYSGTILTPFKNRSILSNNQ